MGPTLSDAPLPTNVVFVLDEGTEFGRDGPVLHVFFTDQRPLRNHRDLMRADKKKAVAFGHALIREGVYCTPGGKLYLSLAHGDQDIDRTIELAAAFRAVA